MSETFNTTCQICGKKYNHCLKCKQFAGYRAVSDKPECYQIYIILREHLEEIISDNEAALMFEHIGITFDTDLSELIPAVAEKIKMIINKGTEINNKIKKK